jgi:hypothetical protein
MKTELPDSTGMARLAENACISGEFVDLQEGSEGA